jgi:hypothetical protein
VGAIGIISSENYSPVDVVSITFQLIRCRPIMVAEPYKALIHSYADIVGLYPIQGVDVCVCLFCLCAVLCAGSGLETG